MLPLHIDDAFGIVTFAQQFRYLGAISVSSLSDGEEIAQRLRSAAAAFGCLRKWVFGQSFGSRPRCRGRAHSYGHDLTRELQLICFNTDRAAVQLGVSLSWGAAAQDREKWRKLAARLPLAPVTVGTKSISEQARTEQTQSEHAQPAPDPAATTWSQRMRSRG
jgi:hypothetical protein